MFSYDKKTNRLCIKEDRDPPWIREFCGSIRTDRSKTWLYCPECRDRYCTERGQRNRSHIPYRDKASQYNLRPHTRSDEIVEGDPAAQGSNTQPEPEEEPPQEDAPMEQDSDNEGVDDKLPLLQEGIPELPAPTTMPTLDAYKKRWEEKLAHHMRASTACFSTKNLVPTPVSQLWQDCPYVPFDQLHSGPSF